MMSERYKRNQVLVLVVLLMLQECQIVLMLNIDQMKLEAAGVHIRADADAYAEETFRAHPKHDVKREIRDEDVSEVTAIVKQTGELYKEFDRNWTSILDDKGCSQSDLEEARAVWMENGALVLPLYLSSFAVVSYLKGCDDLMTDQVKDLIDNVGKEDAIDYIHRVIDTMNARNNEDEEEDADDDGIFDPEGEDAETLGMVTQSLTENIQVTEGLSNIFLSMNESNGNPAQSIQGIDELLENTMNNYLVTADILQNEDSTQRKRREASGQRKMTSTEITFIRKSGSHSLDNFIKEKFHIEYSKYVERALTEHHRLRHESSYQIDNSNNQQQQRNQYSINTRSMSPMSQLRMRRQLDEVDTEIFFMKSKNVPCMLLTFQAGELFFSNFDELSITSQLWIFNNGQIQHYKSGFFLTNADNDTLTMEKEPSRITNFKKQNEIMKLSDSECAVNVVSESGTPKFKTHCRVSETNTGIDLIVIPLNESQADISLVACLFFIQKENSCKVLTRFNDKLSMRTLDENIIGDQLWYWDNSYIRNSKTHSYLTTDWIESEVSLQELFEGVNQRWAIHGDALVAEDLPEGNALIFKEDSTVTVEFKEDYNSEHWNVSLLGKHENKVPQCMDTGYFAIIHDAFPCKVLCVEETEAEFGAAWIKILITSIAFAAGLLCAAPLYMFCFEGKEAIIAGIVLGVMFVGVSLIVIYKSDILKIEYLTVYFDEFAMSDQDNCLWIETHAGIQHMKHGKYMSLEKVGSNEIETIQLKSNSDQKWFLRDNAIRLENNNCQLSIAPHTSSETGSFETLSFECIDEDIFGDAWKRVDYGTSSNFEEETSCVYFLRLKDKDSCEVLSTEIVANSTTVKTKMPSNDLLYHQLWYIREKKLFNVFSGDTFNLSVSALNSSIEKVAFTDKEAEMGFFGGCRRNLYFIKSDTNPCLLMTYIKEGDIEYVEFREFNGSNILGQLWEHFEGKPRHAFSGYLVQSVNFTEVESVLFDDNFSSYSDKVVCAFFLQETKPPCRLLSVDRVTGDIFFYPFASDLIQLQLWYTSGYHLVHLNSGKYLSSKDLVSFQLSPVQNDTLSVSLKLNDTVTIANESNAEISFRRIDSNDVLDDLSLFECPSYNRTFYFIKQSDDPCVVLTYRGDNETPVFTVFDEKRVSDQLWYLECNRLINLNSGLALTLNNKTGKYITSQHLYYQPLQHISVLREDDNLRVLQNGQNGCTIGPQLVDNSDSLNGLACVRSQKYNALEFLSYDALEDISNLMCLFYIRSTSKPCEFLTGFGTDNVLKVRPLTENLIQKQLFYSIGTNIVHQKTGLFLSHVHGTKALRLQESTSQHYRQSWHFTNKTLQIKGVDDERLLALTYEMTDGHVSVDTFNSNIPSFFWSKVDLDYDFGNDTYFNPQCSDETTDVEDINLFFITSTRETCTVLTANSLGNEPLFQTFDEDDPGKQLWYLENNHIVNLATGLVLMVSFDKDSTDHDVVMWNKYHFSSAQSFAAAGNPFAQENPKGNCVLSSIQTQTGITIFLDCKPETKTDLEAVPFSQTGSHLDKVQCYFFIKSLKSPCELLTEVNNDLVLRPINADFNTQLWYWQDEMLVHVKTKNKLCIILQNGVGYIRLKHYTSSPNVLSCLWTFKNGLIISQLKPEGSGSDTYIVGFWDLNGRVTFQRQSYRGEWHREWSLVNSMEGLKQAQQGIFQCEEDIQITMHIIRSEHDDCPILNVIGDKTVGYQEVEDTGKGITDSSWWMKNGDHICNIQKQLCLAVNNAMPHTPDMQMKQSFNLLQRWTTHTNYIKQVNGNERLTYTGDAVRIYTYHQGSDKQTWKWYTSEKIEDDPKVLRCSRCYNKKEETAAEVMGYIPLIGLFYNIGRSIAYAAKKCPKVALGALVDSLIDIAMDAVMILSAGTASAFALGIKTAVKLGIKAGLKAFASAVKSMIKVAVKSFAKNIARFVKNGFKKTLKKQLTKMKLNVKALVTTLKKVPATIKSFGTSSITSVKRFVKNSIKSLKKVGTKATQNWDSGLKGIGLKFKKTFKAMPTKMKDQLNKLGAATKRKMKSLNDKLAKKAENAIKKADDMKAPKKIRCKRDGEGSCNLPIGISINDQISDVKKYTEDKIKVLPDKYKANMAEVNELVAKETRQSASIGLEVDGVLQHKDFATLKGTDLFDKYGQKVVDPPKGIDNFGKVVDTPNKHTEPFLLKTMDEHVKKQCSKSRPCTVHLFTKNSPCYDRKDDMKSCLSIISRTCEDWFLKSGTTCVVSFDTIFTRAEPFKDWVRVFEETLKDGKFPSKVKNNLDINNVLSNPESVYDMTSLIKKNLDEILKEDTIPAKLKTFGLDPTNAAKDLDGFYKMIDKRSLTQTRSAIDEIDIDDLYKKSTKYNPTPSELEQLKDLKNRLVSKNDDMFYDEISKAKKLKTDNPQATVLLDEMSSIVKKWQTNKSKLVLAVAKQIKDKLNNVFGRAEAIKTLTKPMTDTDGAVQLFKFIRNTGFSAG